MRWMPPAILLLSLLGFVVLPYWKMPPALDAYSFPVLLGLIAWAMGLALLWRWVSAAARPVAEHTGPAGACERYLVVLALVALAVPLAMAARAAWARPISSGGDEEAHVQYVVGMLKQADALLRVAGLPAPAWRWLAVAGWVGALCVGGVVLGLRGRKGVLLFLLRGLAWLTLAGVLLVGLAAAHRIPFRPGLARYPPMGKVAGLLLGPMFGLKEFGFRLYGLVGWGVLCCAVYRMVRAAAGGRAACVAAVLAGCAPVCVYYAALNYLDMPFLALAALAFAWLIRLALTSNAGPDSGELALALFLASVAFFWKETGAVAGAVVLATGGVLWLLPLRRAALPRDIGRWLVLGLLAALTVAPYFILRLKVFSFRPYALNLGQVLQPALLAAYPSGLPQWLGLPLLVLAVAGLVRVAAARALRRTLIPCAIWLAAFGTYLLADDPLYIGYARFGLYLLPPLFFLAGMGVDLLLASAAPARAAMAVLLVAAGPVVALVYGPLRMERIPVYGVEVFLPYDHAMRAVAEIEGPDAVVCALKPHGLTRPDAFYAYRAGLRRTPLHVEELTDVSAPAIKALFREGKVQAVVAPVGGQWPMYSAPAPIPLAADDVTKALRADPAFHVAGVSEFAGNQLAVLTYEGEDQ